MEMLVVNGGSTLNGRIEVGGSKNATLPVMAAALAVDGPVLLRNVPNLVDVHTMSQLLQSLGADIRRQDDRLEIDAQDADGIVADYDLVRRMRASICVLGPLLARYGSARVSLPGGCNIGHRPIDLHLRGLTALGANIRISGGYVVAEAGQLRGAEVQLDGRHGSSVTATCNVMTAAALANGDSILRGVALEPEIDCLADFLNACGADIHRADASTLVIRGVKQLHGSTAEMIPDRIETATLAIAAALTQGTVQIDNAPVQHLDAVLAALSRIGVNLQQQKTTLTIDARHSLTATDLTTAPYPGIPTDTQAQFMSLLATVQGTSVVTDRVFPDRFMHVSELVRMGADICRTGDAAVVRGVPHLSGAPLMACDLRASAGLLLAALAADGQSQIRRIYHLDRGYVRLEEKLNRLGANITRCEESALSTV